MSPATSGGKIGRRDGSMRASAHSTTPAKIVIPNTSDTPPALTAASEGPR
jgi:hypothetical protein